MEPQPYGEPNMIYNNQVQVRLKKEFERLENIRLNVHIPQA